MIGGNIYQNKNKHVGSVMSRMVDNGLIVRIKKGVFALPEKSLLCYDVTDLPIFNLRTIYMLRKTIADKKLEAGWVDKPSNVCENCEFFTYDISNHLDVYDLPYQEKSKKRCLKIDIPTKQLSSCDNFEKRKI
ncbi:MAG: hypothetical protein QM504_08495 [Pseudomonadota bacterium]